jgi:hypothetical protein
VAASLFAVLAIGIQAPAIESKLDIYFKGDWVGDMTTSARRTTFGGKDVWHTTRKTEIRRRMAGYIPMTAEYQSWDDPETGPVKTVYSLGVYGETRIMTVYYESDKTVIEQTGYGLSGPFEPERREIKTATKQRIYGSALDPFLVPGRVPRASTIRLQIATNARSVEETDFEYKGDATYFLKGKKTLVSEYHVMAGKRWVQKILVAEDGRIVRVETPDGTTYLPAKNGDER